MPLNCEAGDRYGEWVRPGRGGAGGDEPSQFFPPATARAPCGMSGLSPPFPPSSASASTFPTRRGPNRHPRRASARTGVASTRWRRPASAISATSPGSPRQLPSLQVPAWCCGHDDDETSTRQACHLRTPEAWRGAPRCEKRPGLHYRNGCMQVGSIISYQLLAAASRESPSSF